MSSKPTTTEEEIAHGEQMAADMPDRDEGDREVSRAGADPAPTYKEDESNDPPRYDPKEAEDAPVYDPQPSFEEWMQGGGDDDE